MFLNEKLFLICVPHFPFRKRRGLCVFCALLSLVLSIPPPEIKKCLRKLELAVKDKGMHRKTFNKTTDSHVKEGAERRYCVVFVHLDALTVKQFEIILFNTSCVSCEGPGAASRAD